MEIIREIPLRFDGFIWVTQLKYRRKPQDQCDKPKRFWYIVNTACACALVNGAAALPSFADTFNFLMTGDCPLFPLTNTFFKDVSPDVFFQTSF
jgi:hypothetical protein